MRSGVILRCLAALLSITAVDRSQGVQHGLLIAPSAATFGCAEDAPSRGDHRAYIDASHQVLDVDSEPRDRAFTTLTELFSRAAGEQYDAFRARNQIAMQNDCDLQPAVHNEMGDGSAAHTLAV